MAVSMCVCTRFGLTSHVCDCCQKKLTGDEGWRESETHWAVSRRVTLAQNTTASHIITLITLMCTTLRATKRLDSWTHTWAHEHKDLHTRDTSHRHTVGILVKTHFPDMFTVSLSTLKVKEKEEKQWRCSKKCYLCNKSQTKHFDNILDATVNHPWPKKSIYYKDTWCFNENCVSVLFKCVLYKLSPWDMPWCTSRKITNTNFHIVHLMDYFLILCFFLPFMFFGVSNTKIHNHHLYDSVVFT